MSVSQEFRVLSFDMSVGSEQALVPTKSTGRRSVWLMLVMCQTLGIAKFR